MKAATVMYGYAGFLAVCGVLAFAIGAARTGELQYTALIPVAMGLVVTACGIMAGLLDRRHTVGMIGIHLGLVLPALFGVMFAVMTYTRMTGDAPYYLVTIFAVMTIGSFVALALLLKLRPKPEDRK